MRIIQLFSYFSNKKEKAPPRKSDAFSTKNQL